MVPDYLKHLAIRTPFERPLGALNELLQGRKKRKHPELRDLYNEPSRTREMMHRTIRPASNCIDIGAHLGSILSYMMRLAPEGHHMAFEPLPQKARWLKRKFPEVEVHATCVGESSCELTFYQNFTRSGYSGLVRGGKKGDVVHEIKVPCGPLDSFVPGDRMVHFIKIDVEGAELSVFRGAAQTLRRCRPVLIFECAREGLERAGSTAKSVWEFLNADAGYEVRLLRSFLGDGPSLSVDQFETAMRYPFQAFNFAATPKN